MNLDFVKGSLLARSGALMIGVFLTSTVGAADSDGSGTTANDEGQIEEIVVTATRRDQDLQEVPLSITALSGEALNEYRLEQARQLASFVPNLNVLRTYGENVAPIITIRGVNSQSWSFGDPAATTVYSDDVALINVWAHGFAMYDLERVEVLRGPQGTLFGRNSTAGAMQFVSAGPGQELEGYVRLTQGNYDKTRIAAAVGGPVTDRLGVRVSGVWEQEDGMVKNLSPEKGNTAWTDYSAMRIVADFQATDDFDIRFKAQFGKSDSSPLNFHNSIEPHPWLDLNTEGYDLTGFDNPGPASGYRKLNLGLTEDQLFEELDVNLFLLSMNWQLGDDLLLTSVTGTVEVDTQSLYDEDGTEYDILTVLGSHDMSGFSQELRLASNDDSPFQWIVGGYYSDDSSKSNWLFDLTDLYRIAYYFPATGSFEGADTGYGYFHDFDLDTSSWAVFAHTTYEWTDKFSTTMAVRHTEDDLGLELSVGNYAEFPKTDILSFLDSSKYEYYGGGQTRGGSYGWDGFTFRLGAEYAAKEDLLYYASIAKGYKSGKENLFGTLGYSVAPETVMSYEVGIKSRLAENRVTLNTSVFYYDYSDYQTYEYLPNPPGVQTLSGYAFIWGNIPEVSYWGAELEVMARPVDNLMIRMAYGFVESEIEKYFDEAPVDFTGNTILNINDKDFSAVIVYDFLLGDRGSLSPQFETSYMGPLYPNTANDFPVIEGYWTTNLSLNYLNSSGRLGVSAFINNISDDVQPTRVLYPDGGASLGTSGYTVTRPRTYGVTLSMEL